MKMQRIAKLSENDIKTAIAFWLAKAHDYVVKSDASVSFTVSTGDRPGDRTTVQASVEYHDNPPGDETT